MNTKVMRTILICNLIVFSLCISEHTEGHESIKLGDQKISGKQSSQTKLVWPLPKRMQINQTAQELQVNPCYINYIVQATPDQYVREMLNSYLKNVFKCQQTKPGDIQLNIVVKDVRQMVAQKSGQQSYQLTIRSNEKWSLISDYYVGFLRGLQTFSQLFQLKNNKYYINGRPILIDDSPNYHWRGVMIDSSRHFLPVSSIKHSIDALLYNKMSILHWHITDQDSFPMVVDSRPELSTYGKFSGTYSKAQINDIINYAKIRGVRVIPEFDTPAHTQSWGRSSALKDIVVKCNNQYQGQFDPTLDLTYDVVTDVMKYVDSTFIDVYAHFGGDQISQNCYNKKPSIKQWMDEHGIANYSQLSNYYRRKQKNIWRNITSKKKAIYWANEQIDMPLQPDDVIHWWGVSQNVGRMAGRVNEVILSNYDLTYLDVGFGGRRGTGYGTFISWRDLYKFQPRIKDVNVIGGQTCMWAQTSNEQDQDQKVWTRTAILNERLWNTQIDGTKSILNIVQRLVAQTRRMKSRGFNVSPVTVGLCEKDPSICFGNG